MHGYKVKILKPNNWARHPVGRLDISVGQPYHEGEKLRATMAWAKKRYSHVIVSVADTLQRHNFEGLTTELSYALAEKAGSEWIVRNADILDGVTVIRWDQRLSHPLYSQYRIKTERMILDDKDLYGHMKAAAVEYAVRKGLQTGLNRMEYLIEELAVFDMLFNLEPAADIYPGSMLPFWDHPAYEGRAAFTRIDFTRLAA
jgi:hypothetical protein